MGNNIAKALLAGFIFMFVIGLLTGATLYALWSANTHHHTIKVVA